MDRRDFIRKATLLSSGMAFGGGLLSGCFRQSGPANTTSTASSPSQSAAGNSQVSEVTLALLAPLTGVAAAWGPLQADGFKRAVAAANAAGGIKSLGGAKIKLEILDTETKPEVAASQAERVAQNKNVVMISGCNQSGASVVVAQVAHKNSLPFVTGTDADPLITEQGSKFTFRLPGTTEVYPRDLLRWIKDVREQAGLKSNPKVAFLSSASLLGKSANQFAEKHAKELGFDIVEVANYDQTNVKDFTGYISKYKAAGVEVFLGTHDPEPGVLVVRAMKQLNWTPKIFGGMYGTIGTKDWLDAVGKDGDYAYNACGWTFSAKGLGMEDFVKDYQAKYNKAPDTFDAPGFAVVSVFVDALERAGTTDRVKLRDAVAQTNLKPGERNCFQMNGVKFDEKGANTNASTFITMVKDKDNHTVAPSSYATMKAVLPRPTWDKM